jgi:hypothetical protein
MDGSIDLADRLKPVLRIVEALIPPHDRRLPVEADRVVQRAAVLLSIELILDGIKRQSHRSNLD